MRDLFFVLDQGTSQHKLVVFDKPGRIVAAFEKSAPPLMAHDDGLSFDPQLLTTISNSLITEALRKFPRRFFAFGFSNQGETVMAWEKSSGKPLSRMVSWQCQDAASILAEKSTHFERIRRLTGLIPSPYFSAAKIEKLLRVNEWVKRAAKRSDLVLGTLDTWMIAQWTENHTLVTDPTTACRTQLFDTKVQKWSHELTELFNVPEEALARVISNHQFEILCDAGPFAEDPVPLVASLCDQPASLIGHGGLQREHVKISFGTGAFVDFSCRSFFQTDRLLTSILHAGTETSYYLEGGVLSFASAIDWLEKNFHLSRGEIVSGLNQETPIKVLPAFSGLGAPYFRSDQQTRMEHVGLEHTGRDIAVATVQALFFRIGEILAEMDRYVALPPRIHVDGGLSSSPALMQYLADVSGREIVVKDHPQVTSIGVAKVVLKKLGHESSDNGEEYTSHEPKSERPRKQFVEWQAWCGG